ncbi:CPBP family intramembrane metalloprotease [Halobacillus kuroshimensis]|uniref:CPBP family intramembrane metalloprotease n=1 Tax=Halobacillus kuroshimensis TaxID=302481 RepID=A0ABS3DTT8_9BACI|nr:MULTISPECIES: CPBP family intramembrane glutamic endopeptidase [Halobacillus]MBN8234727.1 CPBP family intramembrane metalloprotease [Halobacillus kuroshimensis]
MRKAQQEMIQEMSDKQITFHLLLTQMIILSAAVVASAFLFDPFLSEWQEQFHINWRDWWLYGVIPGLIVLLIDLFLMYVLPESAYDDGGVNKRVFASRSFPGIIFITLLVAVSEEMLFRGVLHHEFGYITASVLFAILHIRYLKRVVLLLSVLFVSFFIGYMYEATGSLAVTITAHFIIDVVLGVWIRLGKWGEKHASDG